VPKVPAVQNVPVVNNIPTIPTAVNPTVPQVKKEETKKTETGGGGEKRGKFDKYLKGHYWMKSETKIQWQD